MRCCSSHVYANFVNFVHSMWNGLYRNEDNYERDNLPRECRIQHDKYQWLRCCAPGLHAHVVYFVHRMRYWLYWDEDHDKWYNLPGQCRIQHDKH